MREQQFEFRRVINGNNPALCPRQSSLSAVQSERATSLTTAAVLSELRNAFMAACGVNRKSRGAILAEFIRHFGKTSSEILAPFLR